MVIPVRDRPAGLDRCLAALGPGYPVIVVDDGSLDPDAIAALCRGTARGCARRPAPGGPGPARNDGLALVTTPLVAFLDSDCAAGPDWIAGLAAALRRPDGRRGGAAGPAGRPGPALAGRYLARPGPGRPGPGARPGSRR